MKKTQKKALGRGLRALVSPEHVPTREVEGALAKKEIIQDAVSSLESSLSPNAGLSKGSMGTADVVNSDSDALSSGYVKYLPISEVEPNPEQPRKVFDPEELQDLVESIETLGVLQPILVKVSAGEGGGYQIVAGERRWRAAVEAGLETIPAIVRELTDKETVQISIVENVQRQQLNPVEEAMAYRKLIEEFSITQEEVSELVGKKRATIANSLRILQLDPEVLQMLEEQVISLGHAKAILAMKDRSAHKTLARKVVVEGLSVRALEKLVSRMVVLDKGKAVKLDSQIVADKTPEESKEAFPDIVDSLRSVLGTRVTIKHGSEGKGKLIIEYYSEAELDRLVSLIEGSPEDLY